jgi:beta-glucosidase-like glycosyl hydrolase
MKFLDTSYSDGKPGRSEKDKMNIVLSVLGQGLEVKEQTKLNDFVGGLTKSDKTFFEKVKKSKTTAQEKAIVSALLNKYPNLLDNEKEQKGFRDHLSNLLKVDKLDEGALKYMFERILSKQVKEEKKEEPKPEPEQEQEEGEGEQAQEVEAQEAEGGEQPQTEAVDTENSELDFYTHWETEFNDTETELTEDEFSNLIDNNEIEMLLGTEKVYSTATEFLKEKGFSFKSTAEKFLEKRFSNTSNDVILNELLEKGFSAKDIELL